MSYYCCFALDHNGDLILTYRLHGSDADAHVPIMLMMMMMMMLMMIMTMMMVMMEMMERPLPLSLLPLISTICNIRGTQLFHMKS